MADIDVTQLAAYTTPTASDHVIVIKDADSSLNDTEVGDIIALAPSPKVTIATSNADPLTITLDPCPVTYSFGEKSEITVTVTATTQYHFSFTCPSGAATVLTMTGVTGIAGDTPAAGKSYEVDIWDGIALITKIEVTAV